MSSISDDQKKVLDQFYDAEVIPVSEKAAAEVLLFKPKDSDASYYSSRPNTRMTKADFELRLADEVQAGETLDEMWKDGPLDGLGSKMMKLRSHFPVVEEKSELSSFIYEMF